MESYARETLVPGETIRYFGRLHWIVFFPTIQWALVSISIAIASWMISARLSFFTFGWVPAMIVFFFASVAGVFTLNALNNAINLWYSTEYAITSRRIIRRQGLFSRQTTETLLHNVESIDVEQTVLGRVIGYGSIKVTGTGGLCTHILNVANPLGFRREAQEAVEARS